MAGAPLIYNDPIWLERGEGVWVFDQQGRRYLDCYNNVPCVGHCNPRVLEALVSQAGKLNTHVRYLHETVIEYSEQLAASFPGKLEVCFFVCTGTEANELAMRMARTFTGHQGAIVMQHGFHGCANLTYELSTIFPPVGKPPEHVVAVEPPNLYRGPWRQGDPEAGAQYAGLVEDAIAELDRRGQGCAAFLFDSLFDSQGGLEAPADYFSCAYQSVRAAGGLCIADEVQGGFARTGKMWSFENYGVEPDIVTLGKPMGNGHPVAAVVTTREIADCFSRSGFYGNTFGGNPVSAAVGKAVLDEIHRRGLVENVVSTGAYLRQQLEALQARHSLIGNVRGFGLYQGVELVSDRATLEPALEQAQRIPDAAKARGVLVGLSGRHNNVLKIRPPQVFDRDNVDQLVDALDTVLGEL
jgi:4-aminobutyrate aminotransferase-like enzyme